MYHQIPKGLPKKTCASAVVCSGVTSDLMVILVQVSKCPFLFGTDWCSRLCFLVWWCGCVQTPTVSNAACQVHWSSKRDADCQTPSFEEHRCRKQERRMVWVKRRLCHIGMSKHGAPNFHIKIIGVLGPNQKSKSFLQMLRRNDPSFELRSYWPIPDMTGWRLSNRLGQQSSGNLKRRETGSVLFQLEPDMCTKLTFHVTIHSIISTDVAKLLGGLTPWKLALLFCGWIFLMANIIRTLSKHIQTSLFFWLCLII